MLRQLLHLPRWEEECQAQEVEEDPLESVHQEQEEEEELQLAVEEVAQCFQDSQDQVYPQPPQDQQPQKNLRKNNQNKNLSQLQRSPLSLKNPRKKRQQKWNNLKQRLQSLQLDLHRRTGQCKCLHQLRRRKRKNLRGNHLQLLQSSQLQEGHLVLQQWEEVCHLEEEGEYHQVQVEEDHQAQAEEVHQVLDVVAYLEAHQDPKWQLLLLLQRPLHKWRRKKKRKQKLQLKLPWLKIRSVSPQPRKQNRARLSLNFQMTLSSPIRGQRNLRQRKHQSLTDQAHHLSQSSWHHWTTPRCLTDPSAKRKRKKGKRRRLFHNLQQKRSKKFLERLLNRRKMRLLKNKKLQKNLSKRLQKKKRRLKLQ